MNADNPIASINPSDLSPRAIGGLFQKAHASHVDTARFLIQCGERLKDKRASLPHGAWLPWIEANREILASESEQRSSSSSRPPQIRS